MSDPADKSDDLIAELAKLMASTPASNAPPAQPMTRPASLNSAPVAPVAPAAPPVAAPTAFRIPGMDAPVMPRAAAPAPAPIPQPEVRAPSTGSIRIPGMDQPAPVSTSAPVGKFDFGGRPAVAPIQQEPLSTFTDRLAAGRNLANDPAPRVEPAMTPIRIPSDLKPVSENCSFAQGPALAVDRPAPAAPPAQAQSPGEGSDFHFDFGFGQNPPEASPPLRPAQHPVAPPPIEAVDPIAALIEADLADGPEAEPYENLEPVENYAPEPTPEPSRPAMMPPVMRAVNGQGAQPRQQQSAPIPLKPVSAAPRAPDSDRFAVAPNVGLSMRPPAGQPLRPQARAPEPAAPDYGEFDPMSEIESLIGDAVRVELTPGPVRVQTPHQVAPKVQLEREDDLEREIRAEAPPQRNAPVVPPLTTAFAPRRTNIKEDKTNAASAEDAILAAAAASGAEVGRIEPAVGDDSPYRRLKVKPQRSSFLSGGMRQYVGMAVAGTLLLAAGLGLYWVLNMGRTANTGANAPQLTADATPVKVLPTPNTAPPTDAAKSPVLAKMEGASTAPSQEQLVSTDETNGNTVTRDVTPAAGSDDESGLSNRKVRTVTVRPDGSIVSGDDAVAGGAELPIERPNVPAVPSTETTNLLGNGDTGGDATSSDDPTTTATTAADATQVATIDPSVVAPTPMSFPVRTQALGFAKQPANSAVNALAPSNGQQSVDLLGDSADPQVATNAAPKRTTLAAPPTTLAAPQATATSGGNAAAYVQLSSQPSQELAQASARSVASRFGSLFGGSKLVITPATVDGKGTMYRVRLPASSLADAGNICAQIKGQGGDCFATKG